MIIDFKQVLKFDRINSEILSIKLKELLALSELSSPGAQPTITHLYNDISTRKLKLDKRIKRLSIWENQQK